MMMSRGRQLQVGDRAVTDFNRVGTMTHVEILRRADNFPSQSGVAFQVSPALKNCISESVWIDADWFEPSPNVKS